MNDPTLWAFVAIVAAFIVFAAVLDVRTRRLPNWLTVPMFAAGLIFHTVLEGWSGLGVALGGFATGFCILLVLWLIGGGGAGDVKLMGALGAWLGPLLTVYVFFGSTALALLGMMLMFFSTLLQHGYSQASRRYLVRRTAGGGALAANGTTAAAQRTKQRGMPYALLVAIATCAGLAWHVLVHIAGGN